EGRQGRQAPAHRRRRRDPCVHHPTAGKAEGPRRTAAVAGLHRRLRRPVTTAWGTSGAARCPPGMPTARALATFAFLAAMLPPGIALTDDVSGLRSDKVFERRLCAEVTIEHGHATVVVRRTVENLGPRHDQ